MTWVSGAALYKDGSGNLVLECNVRSASVLCKNYKIENSSRDTCSISHAHTVSPDAVTTGYWP
jgi:hypothetical protein